VRGHLADDARIVPIAFQAWIRFVAIGEQGGLALYVGFYESFNRHGGIVGEAAAAGLAPLRSNRPHQCWKA
jgi:hypothetical protein